MSSHIFCHFVYLQRALELCETDIWRISGYGAVYTGKLRSTGTLFAIKILSSMSDEEAKELEGEIDILKKCTHPYIVGYYGTCKKEGKLWVCFLFFFLTRIYISCELRTSFLLTLDLNGLLFYGIHQGFNEHTQSYANRAPNCLYMQIHNPGSNLLTCNECDSQGFVNIRIS